MRFLSRSLLVAVFLLTSVIHCHIARADYVTQTTGHGPFACDGPTPDHGYIDEWNSVGQCKRRRGDFIGDEGTAHAGYMFTPASDVRWVYVSPNYTNGFACAHTPTGPDYSPCSGLSSNVVGLTGGWNYIPWPAAAIFLRYLPECPPTQGITRLRMCSGAWTPIDGSGYATGVLDDGDPAHALNLANSPINAGDCFIELAAVSTALVAQFVPPPGYTHWTRMVAVYTCQLGQ